MKLFKINNKQLVVCAIMLSLLGVLFQYSASWYVALRDTGDKFFYVKKQALSLITAIVAMVAVRYISFEWLRKARWWILGVSAILLALVFVPFLGVEKYGATRWINLGVTTFQPSEIAKFGLVCFIAAQLSSKSATTFANMSSILFGALLICGLIIIEPNMSITICVGTVTIIMLIVGGIGIKRFALMAVPIVAVGVMLILLEPYRLKRLMAFVDPWANPLGEGYQLIQSYYALGGGGLFGLGLFNSRQQFLFLPFAESDFIFSIICEELGFVGGLMVLIIFMVLIYNGYKIALNASTRFECYLAVGFTSIIAVQTLVNIAVVTGSIPPTGLPLPFVSAGGSSLVVFLSAIGLLNKIAQPKSPLATQSHKMY